MFCLKELAHIEKENTEVIFQDKKRLCPGKEDLPWSTVIYPLIQPYKHSIFCSEMYSCHSPTPHSNVPGKSIATSFRGFLLFCKIEVAILATCFPSILQNHPPSSCSFQNKQGGGKDLSWETMDLQTWICRAAAHLVFFFPPFFSSISWGGYLLPIGFLSLAVGGACLTQENFACRLPSRWL